VVQIRLITYTGTNGSQAASGDLSLTLLPQPLDVFFSRPGIDLGPHDRLGDSSCTLLQSRHRTSTLMQHKVFIIASRCEIFNMFITNSVKARYMESGVFRILLTFLQYAKVPINSAPFRYSITATCTQRYGKLGGYFRT